MKQYLKGEAREAVEVLFYFDTEIAYSHAKEILEERYVNPFLIAEAFRDKLDAWPRVSDSNGLCRRAHFRRQFQTATYILHIQDLKILNDCRENRKMVFLVSVIMHRHYQNGSYINGVESLLVRHHILPLKGLQQFYQRKQTLFVIQS